LRASATQLDIPTWAIGGGAVEIQSNTIATFVLDLPRRWSHASFSPK
jgi:hypothetical protein